MISLEEVCAIHELSIQALDGSPGIRDKCQLLAAIQRPYVTFDNNPLYPTPIEKAAAIA